MAFEKPMSENQKENGNKLYRFLMSRDVVTKEEMLEYLGWTSKKDRQLRDLLSLIGQKVPLISVSSDNGYKIAKTKADLQELIHAWKEIDSRIKALEARKKPMIKFYEKFN
jgi:hypothetical protein